MTAPADFVLRIDWMGRALLSNKANKMHWAALGRERTAWGDAAIQAARLAHMPAQAAVAVTVRCEYPRRPLPDTDALSPTIKGILDGLVRGGFLADDTGEYVASVETLPAVVDRTLNRPTVVVTVRPAPPVSPGGKP